MPAFFDAVVGFHALMSAPPGFWKTARTSLTAWLRTHPQRANVFVRNRPAEFSMEQWLEFLEDAGAWQNLAADEEALVAWVQARLAETDGDASAFSPRLLAAIELLGNKLTGIQVTADLYLLPLEYVDALCVAGVTWTSVEYYPRWKGWVTQENRTRDLEGIASDPVLSDTVARGLNPQFIQDNLDLLCEVSGARKLLACYLDSIAELVAKAQGALTELAWIYENLLKDLDSSRLVEVNPAAMAKITGYDPAAALAWSIRAGVLAELTWPVFEESVARLRALNPEPRIEYLDTFPDLVVKCGQHFELIDAHRVRTRGELPDQMKERLANAYSIDDEVAFCSYANDQPLVYWNGGIVETSTLDQSRAYSGYNWLSFSVPAGRLTGVGLVTVGSLDLHTNCGGLVCCLKDGRIFRIDRERSAQWLPEKQRFSEPQDLLEVLDVLGLAGLGVNLDNPSEVEPAIFPAFPDTEESPAGTLNGKHVRIKSRRGKLYQVVTPFGVFESPVKFNQVIARPGGGYWLSDWHQLRDATTDLCLSPYAGNLVELLNGINHLHQLRPRDVAASIQMRNCDVAAAQVLLDAVIPDPERVVVGQSVLDNGYRVDTEQVNAEPGTPVWIAVRGLIGTDDPVLVSAVANLAADAVALARMWDDLRTSLTKPVQELSAQITEELDSETSVLLKDLIGGRTHTSHRAAVDFYLRIKEILDNPGEPVTDLQREEFLALTVLGRERALLGRLASPMLNPLNARPIIGILRELVSMGVLCSQWRCVQVPCQSRLWQRGDWVEGSLALTPAYISNDYHGFLLVHGDVQEVAGLAVDKSVCEQITAADFLSALTALENRLDSGIVPDISDGVSQLLSGTTLPEEVCVYLAGGPVLLEESEESPVGSGHRTVLGLKLGEFRSAQQRLRLIRPALMTEMIAAAVPKNPADIAA